MKLATAILLLCWATCLHLACGTDLQWQQYKKNYNKTYKDAGEEAERLTAFQENMKKIRNHNELYTAGKVSYKLGVNQFSDMTYEMFSQTVLMETRQVQEEPQENVHKPNPEVAAPDSIDWRQYGYVTPVKDQGQCGSCYTFAAVGSLEGQHFKSTGVLTSLSEQNLLDCAESYGNSGCNGGYIQTCYSYIQDNGGVDTESSYPYVGYVKGCSYNPGNFGASCNGYVNIPYADENSLKDAVGNVGPIAGCIYAADSFQLYSGGIYYGSDCPAGQTNHCITIVGYGSESGTDYWLVKNSWGTYWGESGYIRMSRNSNNNCQIASDAHYPLV